MTARPKVTTEEVEQFLEQNPKDGSLQAAAKLGVSVGTITKHRQLIKAKRDGAFLTDSDVKVFQAIVKYIVEHGWAPSTREIATLADVALSTAHLGIHRLANYGAIEVGEGPRMIRVTHMEYDAFGVPDDPR